MVVSRKRFAVVATARCFMHLVVSNQRYDSGVTVTEVQLAFAQSEPTTAQRGLKEGLPLTRQVGKAARLAQTEFTPSRLMRTCAAQR